MELYDIYCDFWEGIKEISVGVCLNEYTWLEICEKKKSGLFKKREVKKKVKKKKIGLEQKKKNEKKKNRKEEEVQFELYCEKLVELMLLENKNFVLH